MIFFIGLYPLFVKYFTNKAALPPIAEVFVVTVAHLKNLIKCIILMIKNPIFVKGHIKQPLFTE